MCLGSAKRKTKNNQQSAGNSQEKVKGTISKVHGTARRKYKEQSATGGSKGNSMRQVVGEYRVSLIRQTTSQARG